MLSQINRFLRHIEVPNDTLTCLTMLSSPDIEPLLLALHQWGFFSYYGYWGIPNLTIWTWSTGSALVDLGLNVKHAMGAITLANLLISMYICLNSVAGTRYRIGFSVSQRMVFGIYGSIFSIIVRFMLSLILYGAQSWLGGILLVVALSGFSRLFLNMKNTFSLGLNMTTRDFCGFLVFNIVQMAFLLSKPHKIDRLLVYSCGATFVAFITILGLCISNNHGLGPLYHQRVNMPSERTFWAWLYAIATWYGALSPDIMNLNDFSRYARSPERMNWGTVAAIMTTGSFVPVAGLLCASATEGTYGTPLWLPTDIILRWLQETYSTKNRAIAVIFGLIFCSSQLSFNIVANGFAGGMSIAGIIPKYATIRKGAFITALVSWAAQPWNFYNSSSVFVKLMSSIGVITTPVIALSIADFMVIRRSVIRVQHLYSSSPEDSFYFWKGFNLRSIAVWLGGVAIGLPGMIFNFSSHVKPDVALKLFFGHALFSFVGTFIAYLAVCYVFPPVEQWENTFLRFVRDVFSQVSKQKAVATNTDEWSNEAREIRYEAESESSLRKRT